MSVLPTTIRHGEATRRLPITSLRLMTTAASATAQSDCVAFSGATIETRPWRKASKSRS